jgi:hypothetical protein
MCKIHIFNYLFIVLDVFLFRKILNKLDFRFQMHYLCGNIKKNQYSAV